MARAAMPGVANALGDLERGYTLPGSWYVDPEVHLRERELIFGRSWQFAGFATQIPEPGDFVTCEVGTVPVVLVRDETGEVSAFVNVCGHRGALIVQGERGHRMSLQCPYHAWTYGLDGCLLRAPRAERNPGFAADGHVLRRLQVATFGPVVFVNLDAEAPPFVERYGAWMRLILDTGFRLDAVLKIDTTQRREIAANWKVVVENSLECYHCPTNHPSLLERIDVQADQWTSDAGVAWVFGSRPLVEGGPRGAENDGEPWRKASFVWPNFLFSMLPGGDAATATSILPLGVDRTLYVRRYCFAGSVGEESRRETIAWWDQVIGEDVALCEAVQRGLASGFYARGRLMLPTTEAGIHFYHRLVCEALDGR